jgi:hypothetical protein
MSRITSIVYLVVSLALIPVVWMFAYEALPSLSSTMADTGKGSNFGPLIFTWALICMATAGALLVAWLSYSSAGLSDEVTGGDGRRIEKV